jgi:rod shape-determining protein MreC
MENVYFRNQLSTAEHARALELFQAKSPSKTVAARVIGNSTVASAKAVFIDRGSTSGIVNGMAVVTPEGIVGKVVAVYPLVSQVLLVTDPTFKVGVESQRGHVHGILDCSGTKCTVNEIQNEEKVDVGEWFFTSGEDRIFPKGFPVGTVISSQAGQGTRDIKLNLSGGPGAVEEVLVVLEGIHRAIPVEPVPATTAIKQLPPPTSDSTEAQTPAVAPQTEADKLLQKYDALGKEQGHVYGGIGSNIPNFNPKPPQPKAAAEQHSDGQDEQAPAAQTMPAAPAVRTSPATPPAVLGARPVPRTEPSKPGVAPERSAPSPVLPLGAPRRKPPTSTASPNQAAPQQ